MRRTHQEKVDKGRAIIYNETFDTVRPGLEGSDAQDTAAWHASEDARKATSQEALQAYKKDRRGKVAAGAGSVLVAGALVTGGMAYHNHKVEQDLTSLRSSVEADAGKIADAYRNAPADRRAPVGDGFGVTIPLKDGTMLTLSERTSGVDPSTRLPDPQQVTDIQAFLTSDKGVQNRIVLSRSPDGNWHSSFQADAGSPKITGDLGSSEFRGAALNLGALTDTQPGQGLPPLIDLTNK